MEPSELKPNIRISGPALSEVIQVVAVVPMGDSVQIFGKGLVTGQFHDAILSRAQIESLQASPERTPFDGDARRFRLGIEAMRLGLAYEYDPYFSLFIAG